MVVTQVYVGMVYVILDEGPWVNILIKQLRNPLGLPQPKLTFYIMIMDDQTTTKLVGLI